MILPRYDSDMPTVSPSQEHRDLKPVDRWLRSHGYRIFCRLRGHEPLWLQIDNKIVSQQAAVELCQNVEEERAIKRASVKAVQPA